MAISERIINQQLKERYELPDLIKQAFVMIPYQISGIKDYSNYGYIDSQINPEDVETFKRVWTGNDSCILNWNKSLKLTQDFDTNKMLYEFGIGEYFLGVLTSNDSNNVVDKDVSFSDYIAQQLNDTYSFRIDARRFTLTVAHKLMFWKFPTLSKDIAFRIVSVAKEFIGKELVAYDVTFESVNQTFANSGRSRQQNINVRAPGQGYINPLIVNKKDFDVTGLIENQDYRYLENGEVLTYDKQKFKHHPVKKVVFKAFGNGIINSVSFIGRPCFAGDPLNKYNYQRQLFVTDFEEPNTPTLFRTQEHSNNFYWGVFTPTLEFWKDLWASIKDGLTPVNQWKYQGWLMYNHKELQKSNPEENGKYKYALFGYNYLDGIEMKKQPWIVENDFGTIKTQGIYGVETNYTLGANKTIDNRMWDAYWTQKNMKVLPLNKKNTLTYGSVMNGGSKVGQFGQAIGNKWLMGLGAAIFIIGLTAALATRLLSVTPPLMYGLANAAFIDMNNDQFKSTSPGGNKIPFESLANDSESPSNAFFSGQTLNISFQATITDQFKSKQTNQVMTTGNIGQTKYENGDLIFNDGREFKINGTEELVKPHFDYEGYIIDQIQIQAPFSGEYSIEFLDANDNVVWSGIFQSEAKWTGSMRELWTLFNTSVFNNENIYYTTPQPYPERIPEPPTLNFLPDKIESDNLQIFKELQWEIKNANRQEAFTENIGTELRPFYHTEYVDGMKNFIRANITPQTTFKIFKNELWNYDVIEEKYKVIQIETNKGVLEFPITSIRNEDEITLWDKPWTINREIDAAWVGPKNTINNEFGLFNTTKNDQVPKTNFVINVKNDIKVKFILNGEWLELHTLDNSVKVLNWTFNNEQLNKSLHINQEFDVTSQTLEYSQWIGDQFAIYPALVPSSGFRGQPTISIEVNIQTYGCNGIGATPIQIRDGITINKIILK